MKKILSILLTLVMMLSLVIVAAVPAAAIDGDWTVVAQAKQENEEIDEGMYSSVSGYEYTDDGFHLTGANWAGQNPWARFVSKDPIDLKEGVYMEIRVDEFNYDGALDSWFNVMFWDTQVMTPGDSDHGEGAQFLVRPGIGNVTTWYHGGFTQVQLSATDSWENVPQVIDDDGKHHLTISLAWDDASETFVYTVNGVSAPPTLINYMNSKWGGDDSEAYVGFCFQHNKAGDNISCTLTKFGTSADDAIVPTGGDQEPAIDHSLNYVTAPLDEDPEIEAGQPGIFMNGNLESNVKDLPGSAMGEQIKINDDYTVNVVAKNSSTSTGSWTVENATSYAIEDFPIVMMVTKNLCTCLEEDKDEGLCGAYETSNVYVMTGEKLAADSSCMGSATVSWNSYYIGDDGYLSIMMDASEMSSLTGRINAVRFDVSGVDMTTPGANVFDVCFIAFFATEEDAETYFMNYLEGLGYDDGEDEDPTVAGDDEDTTVADDENTTVADDENTTVAPEGTTVAPEGTTVAPEGTTAAPEGTTAAPEGTTAAPKTDDAKKSSGCGSVVGFGAIAIVAVASVAGFVSFKKKED